MNAPAEVRIYDGSLEAESLPQLDEFFEAHVAPEFAARNQVVKLRQYRNSISRFTGFCANAANTTSIRGINKISDLHAVQWQQSEVESGLSASTINVHWTRIRAVLRRAAPAEKGNPQGLGLIDRVPYLRPLSVPKPKPRVVPLEAIDSLYKFAAPDMTWPETTDGVTAAMRWRAWLVCSYNLAMRTRDLLGLRWSSIHFDPQSLDPESENESPHGWVEWVPQKTKGSKSDPLVLPLNVWTRTHLESIRCDGDYVFGKQMATCTDDELYGRSSRPGSGQWPRLLDLAASHVNGIQRFEIKSIRKTSNTAYNRLHPKLGSQILGHAARGVNDIFYQQWEADMIKFVGELPQPSSFTKTPSQPLRQEFLF